MGFYVKWKVISIANCEFENEKREKTQCVKISYKVSFFKIIQELFYEPWKDENQWFETFSNSLQSEIIVNEKCSVLFVIICYHHQKNCCFNQKVLCNFLIAEAGFFSLDLFQLWNWLDLFFFMGIFNFSTPYGWNHQFEGDLGLPTGMLEIVRHQISSDCLKK